MLTKVLATYGFHENKCAVLPFGNGLINNTWIINCDHQRWILQRINENVFKNPLAIGENIDSITTYLSKHEPAYFFTKPVKTIDNKSMMHDGSNGYFRMFPYVEGSHTVDVVNTTGEAFEAAAQFAKFTMALRNFNCRSLHITLPDFHNLDLRYKQFLESLETGARSRIQKASALISFLKTQENIVKEYNQIKVNPEFKLRVTHHDTKISNVLFTKDNLGVCVIDLDTVMPGYFISDVGDMMRTYLCPVSEEEKDLSLIETRDEYFLAIVTGYLSEMQTELSETEKKYFVYAGKFMICMQAIRFVTDYLNNDIYYGQKYEGHNFIRALNQATLLKKLIEKEDALQEKALKLSHLPVL
ncbi:MAG: aminoglycoside phosphotransferase family protein [Bacteroidota bacterium]|nr:aminoglycoside phosphotransferase family protein [Bacteroidota bacterium]